MRPFYMESRHLDALIQALWQRGYQVIGPRVREGALVYDEVHTAQDLPVGWIDQQDAATYRLRKTDRPLFFGYVVGPYTWKKFLYPLGQVLWRARRTNGGFEVVHAEENDAPRYAFLGVRPCELQAIALQDRIFLQGSYVDPTYKARREGLFLVVVNCTRAGGTCFCVSMNTGPQARSGFDLSLTEVLRKDDHFFLVTVGTERGMALLQEVPHRRASTEEIAAAEAAVERAALRMGRHLETRGLRELLYRNYEHPRWDEVAARCLSCANCTLVCPTCFCVTVEDATDLTGQYAERRRRWDSCFTLDFSYIHGHHVRTSTKARYRQWLTHKLATWVDQFGTFGCVGCGRCITWCPVGIDITEEVQAIRESEREASLAATN